jgi:hypothetical protein
VHDGLVTESLEEIQDQIEAWEWQLTDDEFQTALLTKYESLVPGAPGRAELLYSAGERLVMRGKAEPGLRMFERAADEPGELTIDPRCGILECLLALDRGEEALQLERELRRASATGQWRGVFHEHIGGTLVEAGMLQLALRWFNMGLREVDFTAEPTMSEIGCLNGRYLIRRDSDQPLDALDVYIDEYRASRVSLRD